MNRRGRETSGIVAEGSEYRRLVQELAEKLGALVDPQTGERCVRRVAVSHQFFRGPYRFDAPDLLIGWEGGYRHSWECATGQVTETVFTDNTKSWSGDHCVDPSIVPGVLLLQPRDRHRDARASSTSPRACCGCSASRSPATCRAR